MNITELEYELLDRIAHDEFQPTNGATPESFDETSDVWAFILETKQDGGVASSLIKKELLIFSEDKEKLISDVGCTDDSSTLALTEAGFSVWKSQREAITGGNPFK